MKLKALNDRIYLLYASSQYEVASAFMRFQEFYESPFPGIRNRYFPHEEYMDRYAREYGNFTYTSDWLGFNIPGHVFDRGINIFSWDLWVKEDQLVQLVKGAQNFYGVKKYYIIGACETDDPLRVCSHELAHAMWYLYPKYKKEQKENTKVFPDNIREKIEKAIEENGYARQVVPDELQAYIATSTPKYLKENMNFPKISKKASNLFSNTFNRHLKELGLKTSLVEWAEQISEKKNDRDN